MDAPRLTKEEREALNAEGNLLAAYRRARAALPRKNRYVALPLVVGAATAALAVYSGALNDRLGGQIRDWSASGFQFAYGVLGIVIAGFAIFTTVALADVVPWLAKAKNPRSHLSEVKTIALHFVDVFVPYLAFICLHLIVLFIGWPGGPATKFAAFIGYDAARYFAALIMGGLSAAISYLVVALYVFVYNVYASFMTMTRAKVELTAAPLEETATTPSTTGAPATSSGASEEKRVATGPRLAGEQEEDEETEDRGRAGLRTPSRR